MLEAIGYYLLIDLILSSAVLLLAYRKREMIRMMLRTWLQVPEKSTAYLFESEEPSEEDFDEYFG